MLVLDWLGRCTVRGLHAIYRCLQEVKLFTKAVRKCIEVSIDEGVKYLKSVQKPLIKKIRENKKVITTIAKFSCKAVAGPMMKTALKTALIPINPAEIAVNIGQAVVELADEDAGRSFGLIGSIGTGLCSGFAVGGPAGAAAGAIVGFSTWVLGETVDGILDKTL